MYAQSERTLQNRITIITGPTGGLGRVVTKKFAEEGARLALFDLSAQKLKDLVRDLEISEEQYLLRATDLTDSTAVEEAAKEVIGKFGKAEILIHLVGGFTGGKRVVETAEEDVSMMLRQHLWTTFHLVQGFVPLMVANGWGRVIVISSPAALSPRGGNAAYAVGKAAEEVLTLSLAQELRNTDVTANVLLVRRIDVEHERDQNPTSENASWTTPEEIAAAVRYICSEEAQVINGARIPLYKGS